MRTAQDAFNAVGVANTDYDKYPDFKVFLAYNASSEFQEQASNAEGNVSYNDQTVAYDSAVHVDMNTSLLTGVILPAHGKWTQANNIALDSLTTDLSALWSNIEAALDLSSGWASSLTSVVANLNTTLADIYTVGENGGTWPITNLVSNGDFENGTSPWSAMKRQGQWTSLQTELHNNSLALRISNRVNPGHSAKYALSTVSANQTFNVTADLNTLSLIHISEPTRPY